MISRTQFLTDQELGRIRRKNANESLQPVIEQINFSLQIFPGKDGHLVSIHSEEELQSIRNLLGSAETGKQFWIGLRMNCPTCGFTWSDHTPVDFEVWRDGEPNNVGGVD